MSYETVDPVSTRCSPRFWITASDRPCAGKKVVAGEDGGGEACLQRSDNVRRVRRPFCMARSALFAVANGIEPAIQI